jgi:hypothetical protein
MRSNGVSSSTSTNDIEPVKIIHKDQDALTCFCINQVCIASLLETELCKCIFTTF